MKRALLILAALAALGTSTASAEPVTTIVRVQTWRHVWVPVREDCTVTEVVANETASVSCVQVPNFPHWRWVLER